MHIYILVVFSLEGWSKTFPLHHALISAVHSGNSQLTRLGQLHSQVGLQRHWGQTMGGALPRAPCLTPTLCIGYHSIATQGTFSQGPGFPGSLEEFDLYKENVGPLVIAWRSLSDVCFIWEVIDSVPDRKPVIFV